MMTNEAHHHRSRLGHRVALVALVLLAAVVVGSAVAVTSAPQPDVSRLLEPHRPTVVDLGDGWQVRTTCGAPGQRVYLSVPSSTGARGIGVSLTVPGGVAVIQDKECS